MRNPSWSPANDSVRTPRPDRIEFYLVRSPDDAESLVRSGALDIVLNAAAAPEVVSRWLDDPELRPRVALAPADGMGFLFVNLAIPPFDDVHVRRAMNLAVDRLAVVEAMDAPGSPYRRDVFTHLALDSYEDNLLLSYAPPGVEPEGDLAAAQEEMRLSGYDSDRDGRCDARACSGIQLVANDAALPAVEAARVIAERLERIGLDLRVTPLEGDEYFAGYEDPTVHVPLRVDGWIKDYPNASSFFPVLLHGDNIGSTNLSMAGASPAQLRRYGYEVRAVPDVDDRIANCDALVYRAQTRCWAKLDQYLIEQVVPWIPLTEFIHGWLLSERVADVAIDASIGVPSRRSSASG